MLASVNGTKLMQTINYHIRVLQKASLDSLSLPVDAILCHSVTCDNRSHFVALNGCSNALINACLDSAKDTIPHTAQSRDVSSQ